MSARDFRIFPISPCQVYCPPPKIKVGCSCQDAGTANLNPRPTPITSIGDRILTPSKNSPQTPLPGMQRDLANDITNMTSNTGFKIDNKIVLIGGGILLLLFVL